MRNFIKSSILPHNNGGFFSNSTKLWYDHQRRRRREDWVCRQQMCLLTGISMSMSRSFHSSLDCTFHRSHGQVPCLLSHPFPLSLLQEKMLALLNPAVSVTLETTNLETPFLSFAQCSSLRFISSVTVSSRRKIGAVNYRIGCSRGFSSSCDVDLEGEGEEEEIEDSDDRYESRRFDSDADPNEVQKVCKVIDELFASDRNMEAILDQCGIDLSHDLVLDVLDRFRHAWKPSFRFFCWAGQKSGFEHDSRTYNSLMGILGKTKQFESMVAMMEEMGKKGLLTIETFSIGIRSFAAAREMKKAIGIFELMKKHDYKAGVDTFNYLLDALGRAKLGKEAQAVFDKLKDRFPPDLKTYCVLLSGWCKLKNLIEAGRVWNEMIDKDLKPDIIAHNTMLEGLLRGRRQSESIKLFELMKAKGPPPNVRSYTILIRDLCKRNKMELAVAYFNEMLKSGTEPDAAVYTCLMVGYGNLKRMDKVHGLLREMKEKGCPPDGLTYNALIKLMTNRQMPDDAVRIYKKMIQNGYKPTIHTYNMMMKSYFQAKNYQMGFSVWKEMASKGCCPDENSYIIFIGGLIRHGKSEEACRYLEEMIEKGMKAPQLDYNKFAADFSRVGKPNILEELAQRMKFSGKFEASNLFVRRSEMMKKRVKQSDPAHVAQRASEFIIDSLYCTPLIRSVSV